MIEAWIVMTLVGLLSGAIIFLMGFTFYTFQTCMNMKVELEAFKKSTHQIQYVNPFEDTDVSDNSKAVSDELGRHEQEYYTKGVEEDLDSLIDQMEDDHIIYDSRSNLS